MACVEYLSRNGTYERGEFSYSTSDTNYYKKCTCSTLTQNGRSYYGYWYTDRDKQQQWYTCTQQPAQQPVKKSNTVEFDLDFWAPIIFGGALILLVVFVILIAIVASRRAPVPEPKRTVALPKVPIWQYSRINLADYVADRVVPNIPERTAETEDMEWELHLVEEGENRYVVELYLAFSDDALDVIEYWALNAEPLETEKMFDEDALERVREAQQYEILEAGEDRELLAGLKIDHGN
jgi:hypothetical protein